MVRASFKPVTPDQRLRELRKEFRDLEREPPSVERAARLATFTRAAHAERQLNMAMHTAQRCLEDDPDGPSLLVAAYEEPSATAEDQLRAYVDLRDLGRYVDRPDIVAAADAALATSARRWVADGDGQERRHRLRTLGSMLGRAFADDLRDELEGRR